MRQTAVSVLVVDDHPALLAGLGQLLDQEAGYRLLDAVSSEAELAIALRRHQPDVVVMDYALTRGEPGEDEATATVQAGRGARDARAS